MKKFGFSCAFFCAFLVIPVFFNPAAQAQDLWTEVDRLNEDVSQLKREVGDLKQLIYEMREVMLESITQSPSRKAERETTSDEKKTSQEPNVDQKELTRVICRAVGKFFSETERILRMSDAAAAQRRMEAAFDKLSSALSGYSGTHRVSKLLNIYQGLTWDAYVAVRLRGSVHGNERFVEVLEKHREKYRTTCPQD